MTVDHSDMKDVEKFFDEVSTKTGGRLDILVNNAFSAVEVDIGEALMNQLFLALRKVWKVF